MEILSLFSLKLKSFYEIKDNYQNNKIRHSFYITKNKDIGMRKISEKDLDPIENCTFEKLKAVSIKSA